MHFSKHLLRWAAGAGLAAACLAPAVVQAERVAQSYDSSLSKRTKTVAVMVVTGNGVRVQKAGAWLTKDNPVTVEGRDDGLLTDAIFQAVREELMLEERYEVFRHPVEPSFARSETARLWNSRTGELEPWSDTLMAAAKTAKADAVLMLLDGPARNIFLEPPFYYGPTFLGVGGLLDGKEASEAHLRTGLFAVLVDPVDGKRVRFSQVDDRPALSKELGKYWPSGGGRPSDAQWQLMADYLGSLKPIYRKALLEVGLRPSCALPFYERNPLAQARGESPPPTLPGTDPARCQ